jgi:hypothetical protein
MILLSIKPKHQDTQGYRRRDVVWEGFTLSLKVVQITGASHTQPTISSLINSFVQYGHA